MSDDMDSKRKKLEKRLKSIKARDLMTKAVITTTESKTLAELAMMMLTARISGMPVMATGGKMVGIITMTDLFNTMGRVLDGTVTEDGKPVLYNPTVRFAMTPDVVTIQKDTTLYEILSIMRSKNIHSIPVFDGNSFVGIIGRHDVMLNFYEIVNDLHLEQK